MKLYRRQAPPTARWGGLVLLATRDGADGADGAAPETPPASAKTVPPGITSAEQPPWSVADMIALATTQVDRQPAMLRAARARLSIVRDQAAVALTSAHTRDSSDPTSERFGAESARTFEVRY